MTYSDTISWMFSQLPMYQRQGKSAYKTDLTNTLKLAKHLNHPEKKFKSIHVAGTNGKGSTSHMLASILQESGYKVGLYTSPHLKDFRERIKINGKKISKQFVMGFVRRNESYLKAHSLSFFEMTVGMAFDYFANKKVDIGIIEVGLGGRLDSTNIILPEVSVITNIGLDHTQFLGDSIEKIAFEKAGIIKDNIPVVIGETQKQTTEIFKKTAKKKKSVIHWADQEVVEILNTDLKGTYQAKNIKTVLCTINEIRKKGFAIIDKNIRHGLINVVQNTGLLGRWQVIQERPKIICDMAHNKEGLRYTIAQLQAETYEKLHVVIGFVNDKDIESLVDLFPRNADYYFCRPNIQRGMDAKKLCAVFNDKGYEGTVHDSVELAMKKAKEMANENDVIYVGGSTFVVAEVI
ncbi:MAG: bifunctional folylpolyglutamate synthase/dihydrofolate synthase [Bacteroidia bacterium]|nr:bifunctional folylpolyglutamate synthase/dihydrofolate synthase [Bacteroidia bacterium]